MVLTLIFIPTLLVLVMAGSLAVRLLVKWKDLQHQCRESVLQIESVYVRGLNQLLALNPSVRILQGEYRAAKAAASTPPGAAWLTTVIARQKILDLRQRQIQNLTEAQAAQLTALLNSKLQANSRFKRLAIRRLFIGQFVSEVQPTLNFAQRQTISFSWIRELASELGPLRNWARNYDLNSTLRGQCSSFPHLENGLWISKIGKAKPLLNP